MWRVLNHTPYKAGRTWARNKDGVHEWIVALKGTFDIKPNGTVELAKEQLPPLLVAEYNGEPGISSLRYDADLVAPKPTTDIIINGTAYAPKGRPSKDFLISIRVATVKKTIRVVGNRRWENGWFGLRHSRVEPVIKVPIVYERAYGGSDLTDPNPKKQRMDVRNPVGCGVVAQRSHRLGQPLPNFRYPYGSIRKAGPAGFGAIDTHWSPRLELMGTYDKTWMDKRRPLLAEDWDPRSLLCSPADQRPITHLRGGEPVELLNLTPGGTLSFALPKGYFVFRTRFGNRIKEHLSNLSSIIIEPDYPRVIMVWLTSLSVRNDGDYLDETVVTEK